MNTSRLTLLACCVAQLMVTLDSSILSVALADLRGELGLTSNELPWAVNAFAIPLASLLLFAGRLSDRYGARRVLVIGVSAFAAASLFAGLATNPGLLFAGRALQGGSAALMSTACLALLSRSFPEGASRAKAFGLWAAAAGSGGAIGVIAGGVIVDLFGWRWTLLINVPIAVVLLVLLSKVPTTVPTERPRLNLPSTVAFAVAALSVVFAVSTFGDSAENRTLTPWVALTIGAVGAAAFLFAEKRSDDPLIPQAGRRNLSLWLPASGMFLVGGAMTCVFYFAALSFQLFHQLSPLQTGLAFLPLSLGAFMTAASGHVLQQRIGTGASALIGTALMCLSLGLMWLTAPAAAPYLIVFSGMFGLGMGIALSSISDATTMSLPPAQAGAASGILTTSQQVGNSVGLAVATTIDTISPTPWHATGLAGAGVLAMIALVPLALFAARSGRAKHGAS